jgi:glycosyltransferase involved in cell wall biosynthesis
MKILYIGGESADWVINTCNHICEKGHEITCVVQDCDEYDKAHPLSLHPNLKKIVVSANVLLMPNLLKNKLLVEIQNNKFDLVFGSHVITTPSVSEIGKMLGVPWGVMVLDIPVHLMKHSRQRTIMWQKWFDQLKYANQVAFIFGITRDTYEMFTHQYFPDDNVILYGINMIDKYYKSGIDIKGDYIVSACRLNVFKSIRNIPAAMSLLDSPKKWVAIGRDDGELEYVKKMCEENKIEFIHKPDVSDEEKCELIKNSSLMIYPENSGSLGSGRPPWEAMYEGKPVLVPDLPEKKADYGELAFYYDNESIENMAEKIAFIHSVRRELLHKHLNEAAEVCKDKVSFDTMANGLIKVFEKMMRGN